MVVLGLIVGVRCVSAESGRSRESRELTESKGSMEGSSGTRGDTDTVFSFSCVAALRGAIDVM